jgi:threonine dehydrogenase-like Zn-dependent dehydrogenase
MRVEAHYHWLEGPGDIQFVRQSFDLANLTPTQIFCKTILSAISPGTELAAFNGVEPLRTNVPAYPRWLGYMNVAEVAAAGESARAEFPEGTIVYTHAAHRSHFVLNCADVLARVPRELDIVPASLAYLYRLAWSGLRRAGGKTFQRVALVGGGTIAQCALELSSKSQCLLVSDHEGAKSALDTSVRAMTRAEAESGFVAKAAAESELFDLVLVTTNTWRDWRIALSLARFGGIISVLGFPGRGQGAAEFNPLMPSLFYDRQLVIMSAGQAAPGAGAGRENPAALNADISELFGMMVAQTIYPARLCMGLHPARDLAGAYRLLQKPDRGAGTLVLDWRNL